MPTVPIIGSEKTVVIHRVLMQMYFSCPCGHEGPLVIADIDRKVACPTCGDVYVIGRVQYDVDPQTADATMSYAIYKLERAQAVRPVASMFGRH
jgi:predicted RNA-binding Zn-ribbon protein involved in translation (DUF1610 family)